LGGKIIKTSVIGFGMALILENLRFVFSDLAIKRMISTDGWGESDIFYIGLV
jgi:hypothetical protein